MSSGGRSIRGEKGLALEKKTTSLSISAVHQFFYISICICVQNACNQSVVITRALTGGRDQSVRNPRRGPETNQREHRVFSLAKKDGGRI